jgi:hypothetical protein
LRFGLVELSDKVVREFVGPTDKFLVAPTNSRVIPEFVDVSDKSPTL